MGRQRIGRVPELEHRTVELVARELEPGPHRRGPLEIQPELAAIEIVHDFGLIGEHTEIEAGVFQLHLNTSI
jgi:hypothetical protein